MELEEAITIISERGDDEFARTTLIEAGRDAHDLVLNAFIHPHNRDVYETMSEVIFLRPDVYFESLLELADTELEKSPVLWLFGQWKDKRGLPYLLKALESKDSQIRYMTILSLRNFLSSQCNHKEIRPYLEKHLHDRSKDVRFLIQETLKDFG